LNFHPRSCGEEVVRRDEGLESVLFRRLEDPLHVLDGLIFDNATTNEWPRKAPFAQDLILWIDETTAVSFLLMSVPPTHICLTEFWLDH